MEFILVHIKDRPADFAAVLINGEELGHTGEVVTLGSPGWTYVSVDFPKAQEQLVNVKNTTALHPRTIIIECV